MTDDVTDEKTPEMTETTNSGCSSRDLRASLAVLCSYAAFYILFFLPVLVDKRLLAPGDGFIFYYPVMERPFSLWSNLILSGYPTFADSQFMTWYPLRFSGLGYNGVVISAYVMASFFTYGVAKRITGSHLAGAFGGLVFGMCGFMAAHMGHLTIIHAAAWIPLILWSLDHVTIRPTAVWWLIGAGAIACSFLGGHPQIFVYGLLLAGAFAAHRLAGIGRNNFPMMLGNGAVCLGMVVMGLALAAIQIVPLIEVTSSSVRQALDAQQGWTFQQFVAYSLPLKQLPIILFPNLFGGIPSGAPLDIVPYFGAWNLTEISGYFGASTLLLALVAIGAWPRRGEALFWTAVALVSIAYALGGGTPLGRLAYHLPALNKFEAPARSVMIFDLSIAVLASMGLKALIDGRMHRNCTSWCVRRIHRDNACHHRLGHRDICQHTKDV